MSQPGPSTQSHMGVGPFKEKGRKNHYCHLCQYFTSRKEDLDNHLGFKHQIGKLYFCYVGKCRKADGLGTQKEFLRNLNQHIRTQHKGVFLYPCKVLNCEFRTDSEGIFKTHMVKVHVDDKEKDFTCPKCNKLSCAVTPH